MRGIVIENVVMCEYAMETYAELSCKSKSTVFDWAGFHLEICFGNLAKSTKNHDRSSETLTCNENGEKEKEQN